MSKSLLPLLLLLLTACVGTEGETVESTYMLQPYTVPAYAHQRGGASSIDQRECRLTQEGLDYLYSSFLQKAYCSSQDDYQRMLHAYREGLDASRVAALVAASPAQAVQRRDIELLMQKQLDETARIAGMGTEKPSEVRGREAEPGRSGYVGHSISDGSITFVDERGFAPAELFVGLAVGSIALDQALNLHLSADTLGSPSLQLDHRNATLPASKNYTALEHHWDVSYGYIQNLAPWLQSEGIASLRGRQQAIVEAYAWGREALRRHDFAMLMAQRDTLVQLVPKALALRAAHLMAGPTTLANLSADRRQAFYFLSRACGLVRALTFVRRTDGQPYLSSSQADAWLAPLYGERGLWAVNAEQLQTIASALRSL